MITRPAVTRKELLGEVEQFLIDREAVREEISINKIEAKEKYQSRAAIDTSHVQSLTKALQHAGSLSPVVVFEMNNRYVLVAGFHRLKAYRKTKQVSIPAFVVQGDENEAIEISVRSNRREELARTSADMRKSAAMLFEQEHFLCMTLYEIGDILGVVPQTAGFYRREWAKENDIDLEKIIGRDNRPVHRPRFRNGQPSIRRQANIYYTRLTTTPGTRKTNYIRLGSVDEGLKVAEARLAEILKDRNIHPGRPATKETKIPIGDVEGTVRAIRRYFTRDQQLEIARLLSYI